MCQLGKKRDMQLCQGQVRTQRPRGSPRGWREERRGGTHRLGLGLGLCMDQQPLLWKLLTRTGVEGLLWRPRPRLSGRQAGVEAFCGFLLFLARALHPGEQTMQL